jgi:7-cyano-7-deazaguanine synthase
LVAKQLNAISHKTIAVDLRSIGGSALTSNVEVPKDRSAAAISRGVPITYVPARNLIFMSIASGYAETLGASTLVVGVNAVDYSGYPDCRQEFVDAFIRCVNLGTKAGAEDNHPFSVLAPLVKLTKAEIIRLGSSLGVDYSLTTSCYDPSLDASGPIACGHCDSCQIRREGFTAAGIHDPTRYLEVSI